MAFRSKVIRLVYSSVSVNAQHHRPLTSLTNSSKPLAVNKESSRSSTFWYVFSMNYVFHLAINLIYKDTKSNKPIRQSICTLEMQFI